METNTIIEYAIYCAMLINDAKGYPSDCIVDYSADRQHISLVDMRTGDTLITADQPHKFIKRAGEYLFHQYGIEV